MSGQFLDNATKQKIRTRKRKQRIARSAVTEWALGLIIAAIILLNVFSHVLQVVRYSGDSMQPSLRNRQMLVLHKTQDVEEGDIIAFYFNNQILVRRVICGSEKQISMESNGTVLINAQALREDYVAHPSIGQCNISFPSYVPQDHVFVMGDNRAVSMDSRLKEIGTVPRDRIIGKVLLAI